MSYFNHHHQPQRGIVPVMRADERTWLVSLSEAKEHLRVGHTDDDHYITRLTQASQLVCENLTGTDFTPNSYSMYCDTWDQTKKFQMFLVSEQLDLLCIRTQMDFKQSGILPNYYLAPGSQRSRIALVDGSSYPEIYDGIQNITIEINTQATWGSTALSMVAFQAILITIADMYENRQSVIVGRIASKIPKTAQYLLDTMKIQTL